MDSNSTDQSGSMTVTDASNRSLAEPRQMGVERRRYGKLDYPRPAKRPPVSGVVFGGLLMFVVFFGGFGAWAALAPLASAVIAHGRLVVESNRKAIQYLEGGIIEELLVREGQSVSAGDVLIRIAPDMSGLRTEGFEIELVSARANEARLVGLLRGDPEPTFPADLVERSDDPAVASILDAQRALFHSALRGISDEVSIYRQRIEQLKSQVVGFEQQVTSTERQLSLSREELRDLRSLLDDGLARRSNVLALERSIAEIENRRGQALASIAQAREAIAGAEFEISLRQNRFREDLATQLEENRSRLVELRTNLGGAEAMLSRTEIRAPIDGRVVNLKFFTEGGVIGSGETILEIVPTSDPLVVEARINPTDIDAVYEGLDAEVRLTAFKFRTTPTVPGTVTQISADVLQDPQTGMAYYKGTVALDAEATDKFELYPGMPVDVMIKLGPRTFLDYLMAPLNESLARSFLDQ